LFRFVCHSFCCVIQSQIELGIETTFWDTKAERVGDVLPMIRRRAAGGR
jgi:hypothetical protein